MPIAFKDDKDGFYQCDGESLDKLPEWTAGMTQLTEDERLAELASAYQGTPV